jgi:hypothetical protein
VGLGWAQQRTVPTKAATSSAHVRLGVQPLAELFIRGCVPLGTPNAGDLLSEPTVVSIDGTCIDVADTSANDAAFGWSGSSRGSGRRSRRCARGVLRSKAPDGVRQEIYGHLCTHYTIRALMHTVDARPGRGS